MSKLAQIMSDKESRKQLEELAQMLSEEINSSEKGNDASDVSEQSVPDFAAISKLLSAFENSGDNKNSQLLLALREHLCPLRQERIDRAIKLMRAIDIAKAAKESGLLENLI